MFLAIACDSLDQAAALTEVLNTPIKNISITKTQKLQWAKASNVVELTNTNAGKNNLICTETDKCVKARHQRDWLFEG